MGAILAPVNGAEAASSLVEAGARELYLGFFDPVWTQIFGEEAPLNRLSSFGQVANALSFPQVLSQISSVRQKQDPQDPVRSYCVFNATRYGSDQVRYIANTYLPQLAKSGLTGVILSGAELVQAAHDQGLRTVASTMCAIYNQDLARLYRDCGMDRIILPRDVSSSAIQSIRTAVPQVECEVFLMRNGCIFADSHCMGLHKVDQPALCRTLRNAACWEQTSVLLASADADNSNAARQLAAAEENDRVYKERFHLNTCGLCALWRFEQMGISAYKVVGRCDNPGDLCDDVRLIACNIAIAQDCNSEQEYLERMVRPQELLELCANQGLSCYYPEIRF